MKILDCTLRDGGYYTAWDFDTAVVDSYIAGMNGLPVDYLEVGYRSNPSSKYQGMFGYTPVSVLKKIRASTTKKLAVMLNEKSTGLTDLDRLIGPIVGLVDMVRIAVDPKNFDRAVELARGVKRYGFEVAFNMMYMSRWVKETTFLCKLAALDECVDLFCMVDSYGGVTPDEVRQALAEVRKSTKVQVGFHGHNNLQLGLCNSLAAMEKGVDFIDVTVTGMGRGAGNLNTELLLTFLNRHRGLSVDFNVLGDVVSAFVPLQEKYGWGTNLPYMLSGANDIPQKDVMDWVSNRVYSFNSIVRALDNRRNHAEDNARFPVFEFAKKYSSIVIVGGGPNARTHCEAVCAYLAARPDTAIVFATARHAAGYQGLANDKYYCLVGNEGRRLMKTVGACVRGTCILPPYPREMGTEVPASVREQTYELPCIDLIDAYRDSVTTIALQFSIGLTDGEVYVVGYDGYQGSVLSEKEMVLSNENQSIFSAYSTKTGRVLKSLVPTLYRGLAIESVYQFV